MARIVSVVILLSRNPGKGEEPLLLAMERKLARIYPGVPIFSSVERSGWTVVHGSPYECVSEALRHTATEDQDSAAFFEGLAPFLDPDLEAEAREQHFRYLAHYTYPENIPPGFMPDFVSREFVELESVRPSGNLREFVVKNVNEYDVEIFYKNPDLRQYRLDFSCASARSVCTASSFLAQDPDIRYASLERVIKERPDLLRPFPSYIEIELTTRSPVAPVFLPRRKPSPVPDLDLSPAILDSLISQVDQGGLDGDVTVALGGPGEPMEHPRILDFLEKILASSRIKRIYLETYGARLSDGFLSRMEGRPGLEKLHIIFRLSTLQRDRYRNLYGTDLLDQVIRNLDLLEKAVQSGLPVTLHAEILRILDVEDEITSYLDFFEKKRVHVIVQKFNRYIDLVAERRVSDLTPLHRDFCWHLARDFYVTAEGRVPLCRQDLFGERLPCGMLEGSTLDEIWQRSMGSFVHSVRGEHESIPMPCLSCDEWYTFNG